MYSRRDLQESRHHKAGNRAPTLTGRRSKGRDDVRNRTLSRPLGLFTHVCIHLRVAVTDPTRRIALTSSGGNRNSPKVGAPR